METKKILVICKAANKFSSKFNPFLSLLCLSVVNCSIDEVKHTLEIINKVGALKLLSAMPLMPCAKPCSLRDSFPLLWTGVG